jgi:hypothetical protein
MSKEFILSYAKGKTVTPSYIIVFSVENGNIFIRSCTAISWQNKPILIQTTYDNTFIEVPESEVMQAAIKYMIDDRQKNN